VYTAECILGGIARQLLTKAERQAQLLEAAARAFARTGYAATSMEDVAAEAGVTKLIVYRHFEGKEELYGAVLDLVNERLMDAFAGWAGKGRTFGSLLTAARQDPDGFRLLMVHARREPQFAARLDTYHRSAVAVADQLVGGVVQDPAWRAWFDRVALDYAVMGVLHWLDHGDPSRDVEFVEKATEGLLAMVAAISR
jgi:AcrR family transcriptional regulator